MTGAHERLRAAIDEVWKPGFYHAAERRREEIDAILAALNLSPSAASALMDGTAAVVPNDLTDEQCEAIAAQMDVEWRKQTVHENYPSTRAQHRATIAVSPYRRASNDH